MKNTTIRLDYEVPTFDTGSGMKVKKPRTRRGKTCAHQLQPLVPKKYVDPAYVPLKKLEGKNLKMYTACALLASLLVGPATVFLREHVDYLGGHRTLSIPEQIECVITKGISDDPHESLWGVGFETACPIR